MSRSAPEPPMRSTPPGARARHHLAFAGQGGVGHPPAVPDRPDPLVVGHAGTVEEHLVEVDLAGQVAQGPDLDARLVQVDQEVGDPVALGRVGIGAGQHDAVVRHVGPGGPHLLAVEHPGVAVALGPGGQRGQVGAGPGLAEQLAPALGRCRTMRGRKRRRCVLGAVGEQGRRGQVEPQGVEPAQVVGRQHGLGHPGLGRGQVQPAVGHRPGGRHQPRRGEGRVPGLVVGPAADPAQRARTVGRGRPPGRWHLAVDPAGHHGLDLLGGGRGVERQARPVQRPGRRTGVVIVRRTRAGASR